MPTYGLARLLKKYVVPKAVLVVPRANLKRGFSSKVFALAPKITASEDSNCGRRAPGPTRRDARR